MGKVKDNAGYGEKPFHTTTTDSKPAPKQAESTDAGVTTGTTPRHPDLVTQGNPMVRGDASGGTSSSLEHGTRIHKMAIIKAGAKNQFTQLPNETLQNPELTFEARGLLALIQSMPEDWVIHKVWLQSQAKNCGRDKLDRIIKELVKHGFLISKKVRDGKGQITGADWHCFPVSQLEPPCSKDSSRTLKTRIPDNPYSGKPRPTNKHSYKETNNKNAAAGFDVTFPNQPKESDSSPKSEGQSEPDIQEKPVNQGEGYRRDCIQSATNIAVDRLSDQGITLSNMDLEDMTMAVEDMWARAKKPPTRPALIRFAMTGFQHKINAQGRTDLITKAQNDKTVTVVQKVQTSTPPLNNRVRKDLAVELENGDWMD